jgi:hypothetical protein
MAQGFTLKEDVRKLMPERIAKLETLFKVAQDFVRVNYVCKEVYDRNIKILATMNQLIELEKMERKG